MLAPFKHLLAANRIVLASGSPRRQELVRNIGLNAELCPSTFEENLNPTDFSNFDGFVEETAFQKAEEVWNRINKPEKQSPTLVIAADTIVVLDGKVFGKPGNPERAFEMLTDLVGKPHDVYTGVAIKHNKGVVRFTETVRVYFGKATAEQIKAYVDTGEPLDKAGGYGIQNLGGSMIERIEGDYFTVMGLPLHRLCCEICKIFEYEIK